MASRVIRLPSRYYRHAPAAQRGYVTEDLDLSLDETVFMIIDVYGQGFDPDGDTGNQPEFNKADIAIYRPVVVDFIRPAKDAAKSIGVPIVYLNNYLSPAMTERNEWRNMSIRTVGVDVLEAWQEPNDVLSFSKIIAPEPGDYFIQKQHYSGFFETHLESLLKDLGPARNLVMVGFDSRICLGTTAVDAMYRNYRVIVLRDCARTYEFPETEEAQWANFMAIRQIETIVGYTSTRDEWVAACAAGVR
jgi:nicotinamidase-related amidase